MNDFTGTYNWPMEEAIAEAESFHYMICDANPPYTMGQLQQQIDKLAVHWIKVFGKDAQGQEDMTVFVNVFNERTSSPYYKMEVG